MWKRGVLALSLGLLALASGCFELKETITLNPDGKGKAEVDLVTPANPAGASRGGPDRSLDQIKKEAVGKVLFGHAGVTAWKDVSAEWLPDGRLRFRAIAYFDDLARYSGGEGIGLAPHFQVKKGGEWKLVSSVGKGPGKPPKPKLDPKALSDKDLDDHVFKTRVKYQDGKAVLVALLTDYKYQGTFKLPGKVKEARGLSKDGDRSVVAQLDGPATLRSFQAVMAKDNAFFRKLMREAGTVDIMESELLLKEAVPKVLGSATLQDVGKDQFDYDKEVKAARAGYPALRKVFDIDSKRALPGEPGPGKGKDGTPR
jgi:hypothetical protein